MAYDGTLRFDTKLDTDGFQKGANTLAGIAGGMTVFSIVEKGFQVIIQSVDAAVARFDTLERFPRIMEQMGHSTELADSSMKQLAEGLQGLPTALNDVVGTTTRIATMTGDLQLATDLTLALNNAFLASGSGAEGAARGTEQFLQILGRGKPEMEDWKTLQETMPYALKELAEAFGFAGESATRDLYSALQSGQIPMADFSNMMIQLSTETGGFAEVALTASAGIDTSMTNIRNAVTRGMANVIGAFDDGLESVGGISGAIDDFKPVVDDTFTVAAKVTKVLAENMDVLAIAAGGVTVAFAAQKVVTAASAALLAVDKAQQVARGSGVQLTLVLNEQNKAKLINIATEAQQAAALALTEATEKRATATKLASIAATAKKTAATALAEAQDKRAVATALTAMATEQKEIAVKTSGITAMTAKAAAKKLEADATALSTAATIAETKAETLNIAATKASTVAEKAGVAATTAETVATSANVIATEAATAAKIKQGAAITVSQALMGVLSGKIGLVTAAKILATKATLAWNAAWAANPIGIAIGIIAGAMTATYALTKAIKANNEEIKESVEKQSEFREAQDAVTASLKESEAAFEEDTAAIMAKDDAIRTSIAAIRDMAAANDGTAESERRLMQEITFVNSLIGEGTLAYNEQTNEVEGLTEATDEYLDSLLNAALLSTYKEELEELATLYAEQIRLAREAESEMDRIGGPTTTTTTTVDAEGNEISATYDTSGWDIWAAQAENANNEAERLKEQINGLTGEVIDLGGAQTETGESTGYLVEQTTEAGESISDLAEKYGTTVPIIRGEMAGMVGGLDEWVERQDEAAERIQESLETLAGHYYNANDKISLDNTLTTEELAANLAHNQELITNYATNLNSIADLAAQNDMDLNSRTIDFLMSNTEQAIATANEIASLGKDDALALLSELDAGFAESASGSGEAYIEAWGALSSGIESEFSNATDAATTGAEGLSDAVLAPLETMEQDGTLSTTALTDGITNTITGAIPNVTSAATSIVSGIGGELSKLLSTGTNSGNFLITGLLNAMNRGAGSLYSKADEIANTIASTLESAWDINSPSRVAYGIMSNFMGGLSISMDDGKRVIELQTLDLANSITDSFTGLNPLNMTAIDRAFPNGSNGSNTTNHYFSQTVTVTGMENITESKLTAELLKQQKRLQWQLP